MTELLDQENIHIARPYALAVFENARDKKNLPAWRSFLKAAVLIVKDSSALALLKNPEISEIQLLELFISILKPVLNSERENFLKLLAQNQRWLLLPQIFDLFNIYVNELEKMSKVRLVTAIQVEETYKQKLIQALTNRIHHDVTLNCHVDPHIIGGAIIHLGDRVIDGSVRGKLTRLLQNLTG